MSACHPVHHHELAHGPTHHGQRHWRQEASGQRGAPGPCQGCLSSCMWLELHSRGGDQRRDRMWRVVLDGASTYTDIYHYGTSLPS